MEQDSSLSKLTERQKEIYDLIRSKSYVTIAALSEAFGVSAHTVRRDLEVLARHQLVDRVHGGAAPKEKEPDRSAASVPFLEEKRRIGEAAAALVEPGEVICIDAGSTTLEVARHLPSGIGVLTNSVNIAYEIALRQSNIDVTLTGGSVTSGQGQSFGLSGPATLQSLERVGRVSKTIVGALGLEFDHGITDRWHYLAQVKRKMIEIADTVILVMDASKIGKQYLERISGLDAIDILVTDSRISDSDRERLEKLGIRVIVC